MSSAHLKKFASVEPADIEWRDGLPFSREFNDIYYSSISGVDETTHVFLNGCQLEEDWTNLQQRQFNLVELGFGSGLNFLTTAALWKKVVTENSDCRDKRLHFISIEKRPFSLENFKKSCQLWPQFDEFSKQLISQYPSPTYGRHRLEFDSINLSLTLLFMPVEEALEDLLNETKSQQNKLQINHWFLDGFAPAKNQSMWHEKLFNHIAQLSTTGTRLASFSVAAAAKTPLKNVGFKIEKRKGYAHKREMLTAQMETQPLHVNSQFINLKYERPWFQLSKSIPSQKVAIIGGGIAGCSIAYQLTRQGIKIDLFESADKLAAQASGAAAGIFHPQLTADFNLNSQFNWLAYCYLINFLKQLSDDEMSRIILSQGVVRLLPTEKQKQQIISLSEQFGLDRWIKKSEQTAFQETGIFYPDAAALNMTEFCQLLMDKIPAQMKSLHFKSQVNNLSYQDGLWYFDVNNRKHEYHHVVFCGGAKSHLLNQLINWPINITRGQTCLLNQSELPQPIQETLCERLYLVPHGNKQLHIGSSFEDFDHEQLNPITQQQLLLQTKTMLQKLDVPFLSKEQIEQLPITGTLGFRLHSQDRLPLVGGLPDHEKIKKDFGKLGQSRLNRQKLGFYNQPGMWLNTGYGSHGLVYSLLASQHLASLICNGISPISQPLSQALSPMRFAIKS